MVQQVIYTQGQFIISKANMYNAMGIPAGANFISAEWDQTNQNLIITVEQQQSSTGTP